MFIVCTVTIPTEEGLPLGWAQLLWGKVPPIPWKSGVGVGPEDL